MKINKAEMNVNAFKPRFKSIRTDKKTVEQLKTGEKPILENTKLNIYAALNNLSSSADRSNIEFLLDIAKNLAYGQGGHDSDFKSFLDEEGLTPENRENTDWSKVLDDTIRRALSSSSDNVTDLEAEYNEIFNTKKPLTEQQKKIIDLRNEFTLLIIGEDSLKDSESLARTARLRKNLDYFIASSEIPLSQRQDCLEKFIKFMGDGYKIVPQLADKKLQVVDEMLNDLIIKTPEDDILTIKTVDQRQSGICAAISICRKLMAYEDKSRYVDLIMEELKDSPDMSVYDVTELGSGKKVNIPKTPIDYDIALSKGYRIIDASAHNWMHNAHASGDGTIQTEYYISFDDENFGIFNDTSWYLGLDQKYADAKNLLMAVIKEKELLKSCYRAKKDMQDTFVNLAGIKKEHYETEKLINGKLNSLFSEIFPRKSNKEISFLITSLKSFYTDSTEENAVNVPSKLPLEEKQRIISDYVISLLPDITDEQKEKVRTNSGVLYSMLDEYNQNEIRLKKIKKFGSPRSKYLYNKKLFNAAAAHRVAVEADVNMPDGVVRFERIAGLPPREIQILNYLKSIKTSLNSTNFRQKWLDKEGNVTSPSVLEADLLADMIKMESVIPNELDAITKKLFEKSVKELVITLFDNVAQTIKEGNLQALENTKITMGFKGDKHDVIEKLQSWSKKLSSPSSSNKDLLEAIRLLGYEDRIHFVSIFISHYMSSIQEGISEDQYKRLVKIFGGEDKVGKGIESQFNKFERISQKYYAIQDKWQMPYSRAQILNQLEKQHFVISRQKLEILKNRFASIEQALTRNEKIKDIKQRKKANSKLYQFQNDEIEIFDSIKKSLPQMKKYCEMEYQSLNKFLYDALEDQYSNIGMLNGQFWVREEGSSGLAANEQIRIIEQMTGKPYHMEKDAIDAAEQIKKGKGSGIQSLSVDDSDYAFHAQYVPSVTSEIFVNPITGEKTVQDIMWTDNSWGKAEKEHFWDGRNGFLYTDYGNGYGWKDGFILADDYKIGLPVKSLYGAVGYAKEDDEKFGLFNNVVLPGVPINIYQKLYKMFSYILNIDEDKNKFNALEKAIIDGYRINIDELEGLDTIAEAKVENLSKRLEKEIKSEADFDKLTDDDELKFVFNKLAVYMSTDNPTLAESVYSAENQEDLQALQDEIFQEHMEIFSSIIGKSDSTLDALYEYSYDKLSALFDDINEKYGINYPETERKAIISGIFYNEDALAKHNGALSKLEEYFKKQVDSMAHANIDNDDAREYFISNAKNIILKSIDESVRIKSLDSISLVNSPLGNEFIDVIDKYLNPSSDEELLALIQGFQMADYDTVNKFFSALQPEDVGIKMRKPYDYVRMYLSGDSSVTKVFNELISTYEIYKNMKSSSDEETLTPEELYRLLYVKLSEMDVQKYIKAFKAEAFQKYKVRQAFPEPIVLPDESIAKTVDGMFVSLRDSMDNIESSNYISSVLSKYLNIKEELLYQSLFSSLLERQDFILDEDNTKILKSFIKDLYQLQKLSEGESSFEILTKPLSKLIEQLKLSRGKVDGRIAGPILKELISIFDDFESAGISIDRFIQMKSEELSALKYNIWLMVETNIDPQYRDEVIKKIYKFIDMYRKGADEESLLAEQDSIKDLIIKRHIVKNPTVLLKEIVKLLQEGKQNSNEYKVLKLYLENALQVAQQTKIQYRLVQNQHEAIGSKTKDMLSLFGVTMKDGTRENMDSEVGMLYLIEQLKNTGDNYTILNLFLEQSGLSKKALSALLNNFEIQKTNDLVKEKVEEIKIDLTALDELASMVREYSEKNKITAMSLTDSVNHFKTYIKRKLKGLENILVFDKFIKYIDSIQYTEILKNSNQSMIESITKQIIEEGLKYVAEGINEQMNYLSEISSLLEERMELISSIRVPSNSKEYKLRSSFMKKYEQTQHYLSEKSQEIFNAVNSCEFLAAQMASC